jgi:hypothetical protein
VFQLAHRPTAEAYRGQNHSRQDQQWADQHSDMTLFSLQNAPVRQGRLADVRRCFFRRLPKRFKAYPMVLRLTPKRSARSY